MAACDINIMFGCENCRYADSYGRDCKHGLLFPVLLLMTGHDSCPNYKNKTLEQLQEIEKQKLKDYGKKSREQSV